MHVLLRIMFMLGETASEGDVIARNFDSDWKILIALNTTVLSIGHRSTETMDFTLSTVRHPESVRLGFGWLIPLS